MQGQSFDCNLQEPMSAWRSGGQCPPVGFYLHAAWHTQPPQEVSAKLPVEGLVRAQLFSKELAESSFLTEGIHAVYKIYLSTKFLQEGREGGKSSTGG